MKKGLNALEIIFSLFVLIVVVLVVIRLFISKMTLEELEGPIKDIKTTYNYNVEYSRCKILCDKHEITCDDYDAVDFCLEKITIDISGDDNPGEKKQGGVAFGMPFCEDGMYCFHIKKDCGCGTSVLDGETCLDILCDYYVSELELEPDKVMKSLRTYIHWGSCDWDPRDWNWKKKGGISVYSPIEKDYSYPDPDTGRTLERNVMGADYWWWMAGYNCDSCDNIADCRAGVTPPTGITLSCQQVGSDLKCDWTGCEISASVPLKILKTPYLHVINSGDTSSYTFDDPSLMSDTVYSVFLTCDNGYQTVQVTWS